MFTQKPLALAVGLVAAVAASQTLAQESKLALEEVVVTAQKRSQDLQDTPISITALNSEAIADQGIHNVGDLSASTPNLQIAPSPGGSTSATIAIRGAVTTNPQLTLDQSVGIYVDGVFVSKNLGGLFDAAELERIEVLRGPQGTLYGKNTIGGAINLISRKPSGEFGGSVKVGAGNYGYTEAGLSVDSAKVADMASFSVSVVKRDRDGFYDNNPNPAGTYAPNPAAATELKSLDSLSGRLAGLFEFGDATEVAYVYDWSEKNNTPAFGQFDLAGSEAKRLEDASLDGAIKDESDSSGHSITVTHTLNEQLTLKSITAAREMTFLDTNDYDGGPTYNFTNPAFGITNGARYHTIRDVEHEQYSQELQLQGSYDSVEFVVGAFWFKEDSRVLNNFDLSSLAPGYDLNNAYGGKNESVAIFGQADWTVTEQLTLTAGIRWTEEDREMFVSHPTDTFLSPFLVDWSGSQKDSWNNVSPTLIASYAFADNINTYVKYAKGWKSGGFNGEPLSPAAFAVPFDEEEVTSYEVGTKTRLLDNRLQLNGALFHNEIEGLQQSNFLGLYSQIDNATDTTIDGLELEALYAVTGELTLSFTYGYLDGSYDNFVVIDTDSLNQPVLRDISDDAYVPYASESKYTLGAEYLTQVLGGELKVRADYSYNDGYSPEPDPVKAPNTMVDSFSILNARVAFVMPVGQDNSVEFGVWGKNLTDEEYRLNGFTFTNSAGVAQGVAPTPVGAVNYYGDPRTIGADVTYRF